MAAGTFDKQRYNFTKGFPTRENCDLSDPKEMFLWTLVALPGVRGAQLVMPIAYNMAVSEHLHKCGARLAAEPVIKYQAPTANEPHWMTSPGRWVPIDAPDERPHPAREALGRLTALQKAELLEALLAERDEGAGA
ncbi:minor tail protein [Mycobacterium phage DS6A]|uniref:Minor tail protein n=1 Tax=Mycobacterium phage DS6A TaxID=45764 RepID=G8I4D2_9CAUD|nr:minor tail protein [Mycobacterium phage DS6A]AER47576.1 hypothetical protein DS6A_22 [Mycobacterium phage DS6A]